MTLIQLAATAQSAEPQNQATIETRLSRAVYVTAGASFISRYQMRRHNKLAIAIQTVQTNSSCYSTQDLTPATDIRNTRANQTPDFQFYTGLEQRIRHRRKF